MQRFAMPAAGSCLPSLVSGGEEQMPCPESVCMMQEWALLQQLTRGKKLPWMSVKHQALSQHGSCGLKWVAGPDGPPNTPPSKDVGTGCTLVVVVYNVRFRSFPVLQGCPVCHSASGLAMFQRGTQFSGRHWWPATVFQTHYTRNQTTGCKAAATQQTLSLTATGKSRKATKVLE